jgi:surface protein
MGAMFKDAKAFNRDLFRWDTSSVISMKEMFSNAISFNGDISNFDVSNVRDFTEMFATAIKFNRDISRWDVSSATDLDSMFSGATTFNIDISNWDVRSALNMDFMFYHAASFMHSMCSSSWARSTAAQSAQNMFAGSRGSISSAGRCMTMNTNINMNTGHTGGMSTFTSTDKLKSAIDACLNMDKNGDCFNGPHGPMAHWDVSRITDMSSLFHSRKDFNGDLSKWDVSSVTNMAFMFLGATSFDGDLSRWRTSRVRTMEGMFQGCDDFNGDLSMWDVSNVRNMQDMFRSAITFNGDISRWDCSRVTAMNRMFMFAKFFNRDISKWDTSSCTNMESMFLQASSFNTDISNWKVGKVTNMQGMFLQATSFNSDLRNWDVMRVKDMDYMFYHAESFRHSLCGPAWVLSKASNNLMFDGSEGRITQQYCSQERDLVQRQPANALTCPKCGKFKKSGRASCCAPGGAWFKDCGAAGNTKVNYKWTDGANACQPTQPAAVTPAASSSTCAVCGSVKKSRKKSCCGRGGSWYKNCGTSDNKKSKKFEHTWFEGIQVCKSTSAVKSASANSFAQMNAAEKFVFNYANNTAKPSHEFTTAEKVTTTEAATTDAAPTEAATTLAKKTPLPTTDWIENEEVFEGFGVSGAVSVFMSHLLAMFSIFIILLE